ncbi:hypothetical protein CEP54_006526 [Fusarium duplospermum]|uniref:Uncharacterized protein n=1 Tax=Fusarium duplospermum TaxID=1325734 RepID=A0A428Q6E5_9HYPO|nr:hypothetical protein CEP54_006526 [Fusarium duplospermum]
MSTTSVKADHGSIESKTNGPGQSHMVSRQYAHTEASHPQQTGRSHQMLRYLNDTSGRPVTETLQDPSHVPGARDLINLDNPLYSALSHDKKSAPPHKSLLAAIGAQFSNYHQGSVRPANLDLVDAASTSS